jgi:hypothetical protein
MRESFGHQWATARAEGVIVGRSANKKIVVRWTNLKVPEEMEYGFQYKIFKDPSAQRLKKVLKIQSQSPVAPLPAVGSCAVSNDNGAVELFPSDPEVSDHEDEAGASMGIVSLDVSGNQWLKNSALDVVDPRGSLAEAVRKSQFTLPVLYHRKIKLKMVDYLDLFFHKELFSAMVEHTNTNILDAADKVSDEEMRRFVGIMFAMSVCPMSNIKDYWTDEDDGPVSQVANVFGCGWRCTAGPDSCSSGSAHSLVRFEKSVGALGAAGPRWDPFVNARARLRT